MTFPDTNSNLGGFEGLGLPGEFDFIEAVGFGGDEVTERLGAIVAAEALDGVGTFP